MAQLATHPTACFQKLDWLALSLMKMWQRSPSIRTIRTLRVRWLISSLSGRIHQKGLRYLRFTIRVYWRSHEKVDEIASRLMTLALSPESRVGVCLQRTPNLISAIMGIMRAGLAYVPIDPNLPVNASSARAIQGGRISAFLTDDLSADRLPESEVTKSSIWMSAQNRLRRPRHLSKSIPSSSPM